MLVTVTRQSIKSLIVAARKPFLDSPRDSLDLGCSFKTGATVKIRSHSDWILFGDVFVDGEYDEAIVKALACVSAQQPLSCLDIGANSGFFIFRAIDLAHRLGFGGDVRFVAFEGSPTNAARLAMNLEQAALPPHVDVKAIRGLVWCQIRCRTYS